MTSGQRAPDRTGVDIVGLVLFTLLGVVVMLQFITRYLLNDSLAWTEEIARYFLVATAYAGSVTALRKGEHIFLELTLRRARLSNAKPLAVLADAVVVAFHATLSVLAARLAWIAEGRMVSVDAPRSLVYGFVAATLLVATLVAAQKLVRRARQSAASIVAELDETDDVEPVT